MLSEVIDLKDYDQSTIISIYGLFGTGKTAIAATGPKPLLFIDTMDRGLDSAKTKKLRAGDISVFAPDNKDANKIVSKYEDMLDALLTEDHPYKCVVLDTATGVQTMYENAEKGSRKILTQQQWGNVIARTNDFLTRFMSLADDGILPILLFQRRRDDIDGADDADEILTDVTPAVSPGVQKIVLPASRVIANTYKYENDDGKVEYRLRLGPDPVYTTKVTKPKDAYCPDYIINATIQDILNVIDGRYEPPKSKEKKGRKK